MEPGLHGVTDLDELFILHDVGRHGIHNIQEGAVEPAPVKGEIFKSLQGVPLLHLDGHTAAHDPDLLDTGVGEVGHLPPHQGLHVVDAVQIPALFKELDGLEGHGAGQGVAHEGGAVHKGVVGVVAVEALIHPLVGHGDGVANERVYRGFYSDDPDHAFMHGPTFMGNALACSVALKSIQLFEEGHYMDRIRHMEALVKREMADLSDPRIEEVRVMGGCMAVQVKERDTLKGFKDFAYDRGVFSRPFLDIMYTMPPYIMEDEQLIQICDTMKAWFRR